MPHPLPPFELIAPIARGGMAEVWQGRHVELDLPVAVKVVDSSRASDAEFQALFAEEVRAVASLDHPGIVWVHEYGRIPAPLGPSSGGRLVPGSPYLVMELATGPSLARWTPPDWPALRDLLQRLLAALAHCHARGVVHRDLKPSNVLPFGGSLERPEWKLTDFGIAWLGAERDRGKRGVAVGSPTTMAPEQATAQWRNLGPATDLYALGCMAWWLSTGAPPYRGADPLETMKMQVYEDLPPFRPTLNVPPGFSLWLRTLLQKRPEDRMRCAADAIEALTRVEGEPSAVDFHPSPRRKIQLLGAGLGLYGLRPVPLVGRRPQRHALQSAFGKVASGSGALTLLLTGEAGMGKSRLARWAAERGAEEGLADVVHVTHGATPGPNDGLAGAIARHTATLGMDRTERVERLERLLERVLPHSPREAHALAELIQPATDDDKHVHLPSPEARHAIARRYLELRAAERTRNMAPRSRRTPRLFDEDPDPTRRGGRSAPLAVVRGAAVRRPRRGARRGRTPDPRPARTAITAPPAAPRYELPTTAPGPVGSELAQAGVRSHRCPAPGAPGSCASSAGPSPPRSRRAGRRNGHSGGSRSKIRA